MHITFGLGLDARQGPSSASQFDAPLVGRMGLLNLLETCLGLCAPESSTAQRAAIYRGCLQEQDNGQRFYSRSLKVDSMGTAACLLAWRDEWCLGGWDGQAGSTDPDRIRDLSEVESVATLVLPPGEAERLRAAIVALDTTGPGYITTVTVVDPIEDLPLLWRQALARLPQVQVNLPAPQGEGALRVLQARALQATTGPGLLDVDDTGIDARVLVDHLQVVRTLSATTAQHWLGALLRHEPRDRLVVAEERGDALDASLAANGGVRCGFARASLQRPAQQALGLALEMCWTPLDIGRLVDFLTHPIGPFSRHARSRLAQAVMRQPGIGGEAWQEAKIAISALERGDILLGEVEAWLEGERWRRDDGVPTAVLQARVARMTEALSRRLSGDSAVAAVYGPAHRQCAAVFQALAELKRQGVDRLLPREIEQLIAHATPGGATSPYAIPQVGCLRSARTTASCVEPADEVIWWMPAAPAPAQPLPWTSAEVLALQLRGVELRDPARQLVAASQEWLRPLLAARQRFVIVLPPPGSEIHPVRQLLTMLVPGLEERALDLDLALEQLELLPPGWTDFAPDLSLPNFAKQIQLHEGLSLEGHRQSYTSLNELFNAPALYVLKRVAGLTPASTVVAEDGNRLLGVLAHRVVEELFANDGALGWSRQQACTWFASQIDGLLQAEGAVLLMQGAGMSLQRFRMVCEAAICSLLDQLQAAGATSARTEVAFEGLLGEMSLTGHVDLLVTLADGRLVALDIKWRGEKRYATLLEEGRHLQLALYAHLIEQATGAAPAALGYFILENGALLLSHADVFPKAQVRRPRDGQSVASVLRQARATWDWRATQLAAGELLQVPAKADAEDQGPAGTLSIEGPTPWDRDHLTLLGGWE